jgi:hypothetical protein
MELMVLQELFDAVEYMLENPPTAKSLLVGAVDRLRLILNSICLLLFRTDQRRYIHRTIHPYIETTSKKRLDFMDQ